MVEWPDLSFCNRLFVRWLTVWGRLGNNEGLACFDIHLDRLSGSRSQLGEYLALILDKALWALTERPEPDALFSVLPPPHFEFLSVSISRFPLHSDLILDRARWALDDKIESVFKIKSWFSATLN